MANTAEQVRASKPTAQQAKQTALQRTVTSALNELGFDASLVAVFQQEGGPLVLQVARGFSPRETQAILRSLSFQDLAQLPHTYSSTEPSKAIRLRLITPTAKSLLGIPLRYRQKPYGVLVIGRKQGTSFSKKDQTVTEGTSDDITSALEKASLLDGSFLLSRPWVVNEPRSAAGAEATATPATVATPEGQAAIEAVLNETRQILTIDRAWVAYYDPIGATIEVLGMAGDMGGDPKRTLKPGHQLGLDESASGWAVRHRKPRVDHDLASTQGRFLDHKHLYKDRFASALVVPCFVRGQVGGTLTLASKSPATYTLDDARTLEPILLKLGEALQQLGGAPSGQPTREGGAQEAPAAQVQSPTEPYIRKQERQAALEELSAFLATEVREPLASSRAQLQDLTGEGILGFDPQTRVESAMRGLIRVEAILNEILNFAKPMELKRRVCRVPDILDSALALLATDLESNRISVTRDYAPRLIPVRCDDGKMQGAFLSILKNALEAMTPGGRLDVQVSTQRVRRNQEVQILIKNDGLPIPTELVGKVFEPFFTTKRSGTGLGLATVKKIVEEHHGQISIASGPSQGTTVIIRLPAPGRGGPPRFRGGRHRGRGRRPS